VITALYVKHRTVEASRQVVAEVDMMVDTMKEAFSSNLDGLHWMSDASRQTFPFSLSRQC
jgi:predicted metalloendopeptidase